jgi:hypothetical protein
MAPPRRATSPEALARISLENAGWKVKHVWRVISRGDAGEKGDVVLFEDRAGDLFEAIMISDDELRVHKGW